jgi:hypothetical protein
MSTQFRRVSLFMAESRRLLADIRHFARPTLPVSAPEAASHGDQANLENCFIFGT